LNEILVKDIMVKDVAYVDVPGNRDHVLKTLKERQVSGVPVIKKGELIGMVTRSDLLGNPEEDQIALIMTRNPVVAIPESSVIEVAKLLTENNIRRIPVIEDGALVGIVSVADLIKVVVDLGITESIENYFERKMIVVWDEMPLPVVGAVMEYASAQASPVLNSDLKLVGIVSDRDLINASVIEDYVEKSDMSAAPEEDEWAWESTRDTASFYYGVSRIELRNVPVSNAMVPAVTAIKSSEVSECARLMRKEVIDQIPVVTSQQKLMGMLQDYDLLCAMIDFFEGEGS